MSIIMDNARLGVEHQLDLAEDAFLAGDMEMVAEHWKAARLLDELWFSFIPCLPEEL